MSIKEIPLKLVVGTLSNEKGISEDVVFEAIEAALVSATKKKHGAEIDVRVAIDRKTGLYETFRTWTVIEDLPPNHPMEFPLTQISLSAAQYDDPSINVGDIIEEPIESVDFGRIAAQTAKQVIVQKVREAERALIAKEYFSRVGELIIGTVKKTTRDSIIVDLGNNAEGLLKREHILPKEAYRPGDRVRAYLYEVQAETKGPQMLLSRTCNEMLRELFKIEVPEVGEGIIEIKAVAREPGLRAKVAVKTNDGRMDPVGACVGMRGARVQAVSNELCGERVDIILWDDNPAQFVMQALSLTDIVSITIDEETGVMDLAIKEEYLSQAIGRNGQNIRLASMLTGWELNVVNAEEANEKDSAETTRIQALFVAQLDVDEEVANVLVAEGFTSIEEIAYVPRQELLEIDGFDEDIVKLLRARAKDVLLTEAIANDEKLSNKQPEADLLAVAGVDSELAQQLAQNNIISRDDLAEQSVDDLLEITSIDKEMAAKIIMAARAHWFADGK